MSKKAVPARTRRKVSPEKDQICLLEGVVADPREAKKFFDDPTAYASAKGVLMDPKLVKKLLAAAAVGRSAGPAATPADATATVRLPGGRSLRIPGGIRAMVVAASNVVAVYATSTTSVVTASAGRVRRGGGQ